MDMSMPSRQASAIRSCSRGAIGRRNVVVVVSGGALGCFRLRAQLEWMYDGTENPQTRLVTPVHFFSTSSIVLMGPSAVMLNLFTRLCAKSGGLELRVALNATRERLDERETVW